MPSEKALEYTVTNTDTRPSPKYRIPTPTSRPEPTRFSSRHVQVSRWRRLPALPRCKPEHGWRRGEQQSLVGRNESALMASGTRSLFGSPTTVVSALKVGSPNGFVMNDNGYAAIRATAMSNCTKAWPHQPFRHCQRRQCRPVRRDRRHWRGYDFTSRSAMAVPQRGPSLRRRGRLRRASPSGRRLTARVGAMTWPGCALPRPVSRRIHCAGGFTIQRRWRCMPPRTRRFVRHRSRIRHALGRFRQWGPAE